MKIERITNDRWRVFLSDARLQQWGMDYASLEGGAPQTQRLIRQVLRGVERQAGRSVSGCAVEAIPVEGGCVLLLTLTRVQLRPQEPLVCRVGDATALFALAARLAAVGELPSCSLYELPHGYILVMHPGDEVTEVHRRLLAEYGCPTDGGELAEAAAGEYGRLLAAGDALGRLTARAPHQPAPSDRLR